MQQQVVSNAQSDKAVVTSSITGVYYSGVYMLMCCVSVYAQVQFYAF